ncbi:MAG: PHP domain-containing protein [Terriglobales bacterium]|jgi:hypothetical protein
MKVARGISGCLLVAGFVLGTYGDRTQKTASITMGGYRVLAGDFHIHSFPLSWSTLSPWDTVIEAQRQGLDVIAMTGHNHVWVAKVGRWFSRRVGGPTVLVGEEIVGPKYHMLALGIEHTVSWRQSAASAIAEIHKQGGVAIAAHPLSKYWPAFDEEAMRGLDGAEVVHPIIYVRAKAHRELPEFSARKRMTAMGDSDYHGVGPMGLCRTYVFAANDSEGAVMEALRAGHTVVYERDGKAYGDPELVRLAAQNGLFEETQPVMPGALVRISGGCGIAGLMGVFVFGLGRVRADDSTE